MLFRNKLHLCTMLFLLSLTFPVLSKVKVYINPLKGDIGTHDPVMIKQGSTYYVFYTGDYLPVKTSADRINWKERKSVFVKCPAWFTTYVPENNGRNCWAPDISYREGTYWLYYSVSTMGAKVSAIGLATNVTLDPTDAKYQWVDEGMVINSGNNNNYNCIDPNCFVDTDGRVWLTFGSWNTGIKMVEVNPETGKLLSANPAMYALAGRKNSSAIEAPFIVKYGLYYYLFVSWDTCCDGVKSTYNIRVGRAVKVTGPYIDQAGVDMKTGAGGGTLVDKGDEWWVSPGHNGIFVENDTVFLVNHAYDAQDNGASKLMIRPLYWSKEGWPTLDAAKGEVTSVKPVQPKPSSLASTVLHPVILSGCHLPDNGSNVFTLSGRRVSSQVVSGIYLLQPVTNSTFSGK